MDPVLCCDAAAVVAWGAPSQDAGHRATVPALGGVGCGHAARLSHEKLLGCRTRSCAKRRVSDAAPFESVCCEDSLIDVTCEPMAPLRDWEARQNSSSVDRACAAAL